MPGPDLRQFPHLHAYITRIGAEQLNFRRFMIKQQARNGYYRERCLITINPDLSITVTEKEFAPTKQEADDIKEELTNASFPQPIPAATLDTLHAKLGEDAWLYAFYSRVHGGIVMAQQRVVTPDGKRYLPWTFFNDGEWRCMEPGGSLPFWKPFERRNKTQIMVHEGAKAAHFVDDLLNNPERCAERDAHPWIDYLAMFEHWGLIGGALAPHRADYEELWREQAHKVVYVCDNDSAGKAVLQEFSRHYKRRLEGIMFDRQFKSAWDCADELPISMFNNHHYIGKPMQDYLRPATWATEWVPEIKKFRLTRAFKEEWYHSIKPDAYVHCAWSNDIYTMKEFNSRVRSFSDVKETSELLKEDETSKQAFLAYSPAQAPGPFVNEKSPWINTHVAPDIKPQPGDPAPWLDFMTFLIPTERDRHETLRWCATLIARPNVRMRYSILLISETQGVGKNTLGDILTHLIGIRNVSFPSEDEIVNTNYNYWASHKRLAVVPEIYAGQSSKAYNKLKTIVTDKTITVREKYLAHYEIENWLHMLALSNSLRALKLSYNDRRWLVPGVNEDNRRPPGYWTNLHHWLELENGYNIIKHWANEFVEQHGAVATEAFAPWTTVKEAVIEESYSQGEALVCKLLETVTLILERAKQNDDSDETKAAKKIVKRLADDHQYQDGIVIIKDIDLVGLIKSRLYNGSSSPMLERPATVRRVAKACGWFVGTQRAWINAWGDYGGRVISNSKAVAAKAPSELCNLTLQTHNQHLLPIDPNHQNFWEV
jgi:hypothetical protein